MSEPRGSRSRFATLARPSTTETRTEGAAGSLLVEGEVDHRELRPAVALERREGPEVAAGGQGEQGGIERGGLGHGTSWSQRSHACTEDQATQSVLTAMTACRAPATCDPPIPAERDA